MNYDDDYIYRDVSFSSDATRSTERVSINISSDVKNI